MSLTLPRPMKNFKVIILQLSHPAMQQSGFMLHGPQPLERIMIRIYFEMIGDQVITKIFDPHTTARHSFVAL